MKRLCSGCISCDYWKNGCKAPFDKMECETYYSEYKRKAVETARRNRTK